MLQYDDVFTQVWPRERAYRLENGFFLLFCLKIPPKQRHQSVVDSTTAPFMHGSFKAYIHFQGLRAQSPLLTWHKDSLCSTERLLSSNQTRGITEASTSFQNKNTTGGKSSGMSGIPKCCSLSSPAYLYLSSKSRPDALSQSQSRVGIHRHNSTITSHGRDMRLHRQQLLSRNKLWINFPSVSNRSWSPGWTQHQ